MIQPFLPVTTDNATLSVVIWQRRSVRLFPHEAFKLRTAKSSQPRVSDDRAGPFEVLDVAGDHCQPVNKRGRGNQSINFIAPIENVQMGAARRNRIVDGNDPAGKFRPDVAVEPGPQPGALACIAPLYPKDTTLQFQDGDRREEEGGRIFPTDPGDDIGVGLAVTDLAQF